MTVQAKLELAEIDQAEIDRAEIDRAEIDRVEKNWAERRWAETEVGGHNPPAFAVLVYRRSRFFTASSDRPVTRPQPGFTSR
jgi:hypothetical protein